MQFNLSSRRVIADLSASILLFLFVLFSCFLMSCGSNAVQIRSTTFLIYSPLLIVAYMLWLKDVKENKIPWLRVAGLSVLLGVPFILVDLFFGFIFDHRETFFGALVSNGISFGFTLIVLPGVTFIAMSGWIRQKILNIHSRSDDCDR